MTSGVLSSPNARLRPAAANETMRMSPTQAKFYLSDKRINVVWAGRRSGKTAIAKRRCVRKAMQWTGAPNTRFICGAPTQEQAEQIFWSDLKLMVPEWARAGEPSESKHEIRLLNGAVIKVVGLDRPQRAEGAPAAHFAIDEFADLDATVWSNHLRPMLTDTQGTADLFGVPEQRNHFWELANVAKVDATGVFGAFHWWSESVLHLYLGEEAAAAEIAAAKAELDPYVYRQEYQAEFVSWAGRVYHGFDSDDHCVPLHYESHLPIHLCFDFNVDPGVCVYVQELRGFTCIVGECYIPRNSNTPSVCRKVIADLQLHRGEVFIYGDPAGGARHTSQVAGTDWDIVREMLKGTFGARLRDRVLRSAPPERVRINAVNSRLRTADGKVHVLIDPRKARYTVNDFENVVIKEGTDGEIDKSKRMAKFTHLTDAFGYYCVVAHPLKSVGMFAGGAAA